MLVDCQFSLDIPTSVVADSVRFRDRLDDALSGGGLLDCVCDAGGAASVWLLGRGFGKMEIVE